MKDILVSAPYLLPELDRLLPVLKAFDLNLIVPEVHERLSEEEILAYAGEFDGTICGDDRYTRRVIEACQPRLRVISKWGTGIDSIDQAAAADFGVMVGNTPNAFTVPVSESVLGVMLSFARNIPWLDDAMKAGEWQKINGKTLSECTLVWLGSAMLVRRFCGGHAALVWSCLGMISWMSPRIPAGNGVEMTSLQDLLSRSDFISINCTLNPTSQHLINAETLSWVKKGCHFDQHSPWPDH